MKDYHEILIDENITVQEALRILDKTAEGILFIAKDNVLEAALSDGDVRRWLLKNGSLRDAVSLVANYNPKFIKNTEIIDVHKYMVEHHLNAIPIVDESRCIKDVVFMYPQSSNYHPGFNIPVVIMAGGKGTRLYPYTRILPKPLIPIGEIPISEMIINEFCNYGCKNYYFILNYKRNMIKAYFNEIERSYNITYIDEDKPLGTGGGVGLLKGKIKSTFILTNCDSIITDNYNSIIKEHKANENLVTMICSSKNYVIPYGVVEVREDGMLKSMMEKPSMSFLTNTGTYIVEPEVIDFIDTNNEIDFPDVIERIKKKGGNIGVYPINENAWLDMGQFDSLERMKEHFNIS